MSASPTIPSHVRRLVRSSRRNLPGGCLSHFLWEEQTASRRKWTLEICYADATATHSIQLSDIAATETGARALFDLFVGAAVTPLGAEDAYHEWLTP